MLGDEKAELCCKLLPVISSSGLDDYKSTVGNIWEHRGSPSSALKERGVSEFRPGCLPKELSADPPRTGHHLRQNSASMGAAPSMGLAAGPEEEMSHASPGVVAHPLNSTALRKQNL